MAKKEPNNIHKITKKIEKEEWDKALDKVFLETQKKVKVDGFRKGKVPRNVYEKKFGKESLYLDAANLVLPDAYDAVMEEAKLEPIAQPTMDIKSIDENGVEFEFTIITRPEVKIKKYKGLKVEKPKVEVTEEEINHELGHLLERYTELVTKEGKVEDKDVAIIDFEGFKEGVPFDGGKGENYSLEIGSHMFIPGFEEQVIGMKVGDEKDINLTFPEDYGAKDLAGEDVVFKVKVNEIKQKQTRELDEEFFEDLGMEGVDSEKKLKEEIQNSIQAQKEMDAENEYIDNILEAVGKNVEVDIPEQMVEEELDRLMARFEEQMKMQGVSLDLYYQFTGSNEKDLKSQMEKEAYNNVLYRLMLEEIANLENISITEEEAEKEAEEIAKKYQMEKEEFLKEFGGIDLIRYDLMMRKVMEILKENN